MSTAPSRFRALGELVLVTGGKLVSLAALFLCSVLVARAAGPAEYGLYAAGLAIVLLLDAMAGSPLDLATVRFGTMHRDDEPRVDRFQAAAFRLKIIAGAVLLVAGWFARRPLAAALFGDERRGALVLVALLCMLALLLVRGTAAFLQLRLRFRAYATVDVLQSVLRLAAVGGLLGLGSRAAEPFLGAYGAGAAVVFVVGAVTIRQRYLAARWPPPGDARAILAFIGAAAAIIVLGTITGRADVPLLAALRSAEEAGHYAAAVQVSMIGTMLAMYATIVTQPRVIPMARAGRLGALLRWNMVGAAAVAAAMVPVAVWAFPVLVPVLFGASYEPSVALLQVLIIGTCADLFTMPVAMIFGIHLFPRAALAGEVAVTLGFAAAVPFVIGTGGIGMAWLVVVVRLAKLALYLALTLLTMRRVAANGRGPNGSEPGEGPRPAARYGPG